MRTTDRELTDIALLQASRRSQELFRHAAERVHKSRAQSNGATLHQAVRARVVLHDDTKSWRDRVLEARTLVDDISDAGATSFASQVRRALAEDGGSTLPPYLATKCKSSGAAYSLEKRNGRANSGCALDFLKNLSQEEAQLIESIARFSISPNLIWRDPTDLLAKRGISFSKLLVLQELG